MKNKFFVYSFIFLALIALGSVTLFFQEKSFEDKRQILLDELHENIEEAKVQGDYDCCLEPPCTMCYLGGWIWEEGVCRCDEMMMNDEFDKVCPQCKRGLEEGRCRHAENSCPLLNE